MCARVGIFKYALFLIRLGFFIEESGR
jgi:hypothetical protein